MDNRPIGIFDSGLGGLTVVKEIKRLLPKESIIYLGDTARVPYGTRSKETIIKFAIDDLNFLIKKNIKCIVIACNSVSSTASEIIKKKSKLPVFDVVTPTCDYLSGLDNLKKIGVIGTNATIKSGIYKKKIQIKNKRIEIYQKGASLLVPLIEEGEIKESFTYQILEKYLKEFKEKKVEAVVLGCTHYPVLIGLFKKIMGKNVKLIDPAKFVAINLKSYLLKNGLQSDGKIKNSYFFGVTDLTSEFVKQVKIFAGESFNTKLVKVNLTE